jgi:hypothetical protein
MTFMTFSLFMLSAAYACGVHDAVALADGDEVGISTIKAAMRGTGRILTVDKPVK